MREYVKIYCCGDCIYYDYKRHKCKMHAVDEGTGREPFYRDCPLGIHTEEYDEKEIDARPTIELAPIVRCKNCKNLFSCYKWPTEDILNNFCQDGEFGENGYETD